MPADYTKLWEAWVGGWGGTTELTPGQDVDRARLTDFYSQVVGPAWGGEYEAGSYDPETGAGKEFGKTFESYISGFDTEELERAEREFRMALCWAVSSTGFSISKIKLNNLWFLEANSSWQPAR